MSGDANTKAPLPGARLVSSRTTFFYKRVFIVAWLAFVLLFAMIGIIVTVGNQRPWHEVAMAVGIPFGVMLFGWAIFRVTILDVVDEVWDAGDSLVVRNGGEEARIPLADIGRCKASRFVNPERITIEFNRATPFGPRIAFLPKIRWVRLSLNPLAKELTERADAARNR